MADTAQKPLLIALGDSITAGVGGKWNRGYPHHLRELLEPHLPELELINWGIPGLTTPKLTKALQKGEHLHRKLSQATCIVMTIGGNDILKAMPKGVTETTTAFTAEDRKRIAGELDALMNTLLPLVSCPIYFGDLYNPFPQSQLAATLVRAFNEQLLHPLGDRYPNVRIVRLSEVLLGKEQRSIQYYKSGTLRDLKRLWRHPIHPNNEGHEALANAFYQRILPDLQQNQPSRTHTAPKSSAINKPAKRKTTRTPKQTPKRTKTTASGRNKRQSTNTKPKSSSKQARSSQKPQSRKPNTFKP